MQETSLAPCLARITLASDNRITMPQGHREHGDRRILRYNHSTHDDQRRARRARGIRKRFDASNRLCVLCASVATFARSQRGTHSSVLLVKLAVEKIAQQVMP